jgi:hypothetical protein
MSFLLTLEFFDNQYYWQCPTRVSEARKQGTTLPDGGHKIRYANLAAGGGLDEVNLVVDEADTVYFTLSITARIYIAFIYHPN